MGNYRDHALNKLRDRIKCGITEKVRQIHEYIGTVA